MLSQRYGYTTRVTISIYTRIWKYILVTIFTMATWAGLAFFATIRGWTHAPIASNTFFRSFIGATDQELRKQFVGQFAMAAFRKGHVEYENFYTAVHRNTVFQASSLSKWIVAF
jgi:hypothetical protein